MGSPTAVSADEQRADRANADVRAGNDTQDPSDLRDGSG
jgi:hypothetical protein